MSKRPEAGHRPQPRPRIEQPGSATAPSPREQLSPIIPFSKVTDAAILELQSSEYVLPKQKKVPHPFHIGKPIIVLATGNGIREKDFRRKIPHARLRRIPFDEEPTTDTFLAAKSKADSARKYEITHRSLRNPLVKLREIRQRGLWKAAVTVGLDSVNEIPDVYEDGSIRFMPLGKPEREAPGKELETIRQRLAALSKLAFDNDWPAIPIVTKMTQHVRNTSRRGTDGRFDAHSTKHIVMMLDPHVLAYLATPEGFIEYLQLSLDSYPFITQTAAGLKREILEKVGAVLFVSDDPEEIRAMKYNPSKQEQAKKLAERLSMGKLNPDLMNDYIDKL